MTTAALVPFFPSAAISPGTVSGGGGDDREVWCLWQLVDGVEAVLSGDAPALGI